MFLSRYFLFAFLTMAVSAVAIPFTAHSHEFILIPEMRQVYKQGQVLPVSVYSTHVFVQREELEPPETTKLSYAGQEVALTANQARLCYDGQVTLKGGSACIIAGHRLPILWSETPQGDGPGGRSKHKNAISSAQYEKFAKLLLPVDGATGGFDTKIGHRLEIVPVSNPLTAKVGDELLFKVLLDGKPAVFDKVYATYDGFSDIPDAWAFAASPVSHGEAKVRISASGFWIVRVGIEVPEKTAEYDKTVLRAVLVFPVR